MKKDQSHVWVLKAVYIYLFTFKAYIKYNGDKYMNDKNTSTVCSKQANLLAVLFPRYLKLK